MTDKAERIAALRAGIDAIQRAEVDCFQAYIVRGEPDCQ